jgi:hypothetical protein
LLHCFSQFGSVCAKILLPLGSRSVHPIFSSILVFRPGPASRRHGCFSSCVRVLASVSRVSSPESAAARFSPVARSRTAAAGPVLFSAKSHEGCCSRSSSRSNRAATATAEFLLRFFDSLAGFESLLFVALGSVEWNPPVQTRRSSLLGLPRTAAPWSFRFAQPCRLPNSLELRFSLSRSDFLSRKSALGFFSRLRVVRSFCLAPPVRCSECARVSTAPPFLPDWVLPQIKRRVSLHLCHPTGS